MTGLHVIWFRTDLRVHDHAALRAAYHSAARDSGQVLALYIAPQTHPVDGGLAPFLVESLSDLRTALDRRGSALHIRYGEPATVFSELHRAHDIRSLHTHETLDGDADTRPVESWCLRAGVAFYKYLQFGPDPQRLAPEDETTAWVEFMARPRFESVDLPSAANIGIGQWPAIAGAATATMVQGGRKHAILQLRTILKDLDLVNQQSTLTGSQAFERLRPHLQVGALSIREVWQAAMSAHQHAAKAGRDMKRAVLSELMDQLQTLVPARRWQRSAGPRNVTRGGAVHSGQQLSLGFDDPAAPGVS